MMSAEIGPLLETEFHRPKNRFIKLSSMRSSKAKGTDDEKKKQMQDYVVWVNSYLRNKPSCPQITDLKAGMQDGVTLVSLVEVAANAEIPFVNRKPSSSSARKANIEKAIAFLRSDGVNIAGDPVKDIVEGSLKGIMKIVLAIAEKYNPRSVRPIVQPRMSTSTSSSTSSQHPTTPQSQAQPVAIATGRSPEKVRETHSLNISPRGTSPVLQPHSLPPHQFQSHSYFQSQHPNSQSHPHPNSRSYSQSQSQRYNGSTQAGYTFSQGYPLSQGIPPFQGLGNVGVGITVDTITDGVVGGYSLSQPMAQTEDIYSNPVDSLPEHLTQVISRQMSTNKVLGQKLPKKHNRLSVSNSKQSPANIPEDNTVKEVRGDTKPEATQKIPDNSLMNGQINGALSGLGELKIKLIKLHTVLLDNVEDDDATEDTVDMKLPLEVANSEIVMKDKEIVELQEEIDTTKQSLAKSESECESLKEMVMERNQFITGMKTEIYRKEYRNDTEKVDLQTQLLHKDRKIKILEGELNLMKASVEGKDREVVDMRKKISDSKNRESELQGEVTRVNLELTRTVEAEENLQAKIFSRDRKITHLEEKLEAEKGILQRIDPTIVSDEMDGIREILVGLRESTEASSSNQQTLDLLEKSISNMITKFSDHVRSISPTRRPRRHHEERREERKKRHRERGESRTSRDETVERGHHSSSINSGEWTKVFYYITGDKMETPYVTSVNRKASEVCLRDFKGVFDRHGSYRFYFKTEDPDCGVVRQEIINDDHILPAWNGKIMVWATEKAHHR